jgi:error-prone DNA polymerase
VLPVSVNQSAWDCTLERRDLLDDGMPDGESPLCLRMGLRLVKGLNADEADRVTLDRLLRGPYRDAHDVFRRAGLSLKGQRALATAGALDDISDHRRSAIWTAMVKEPPLFARLTDDSVRGALRAPSDLEVLELDFAGTGVSLDDHPMRHVREWIRHKLAHDEKRRGWKRTLLTASEVQNAPHQTKGVTAGLVTGRQRPGTADGTCFVTLDDETGMTNVVVWGRDFERWRQTVVTSTFLLVEGGCRARGYRGPPGGQARGDGEAGAGSLPLPIA